MTFTLIKKCSFLKIWRGGSILMQRPLESSSLILPGPVNLALPGPLSLALPGGPLSLDLTEPVHCFASVREEEEACNGQENDQHGQADWQGESGVFVPSSWIDQVGQWCSHVVMIWPFRHLGKNFPLIFFHGCRHDDIFSPEWKFAWQMLGKVFKTLHLPGFDVLLNFFI